ncbi:MAG: hypothetical protein ACLFWR_09555 [Acidimicrobiales bacterium]
MTLRRNPRRTKRREATVVAEPLSPRRKWRAITIATLVLVPAFWSMLAGLISLAADEAEGGPDPAAALALGFALIPFVFIVLAFLSWHPGAPMAVVKAMGLSLLVGGLVSALAADAVTGLVAGVGAGGVVALRSDAAHHWQWRAAAVAFAAAYAFVLVRTVGNLVLLPAPVFPFTAVGIADHLREWHLERQPAEQT